jgi:hypothetical protein
MPDFISSVRPSSDSPVAVVQPGQRSQWDQLEETLKDLEASGYQHAFEEVHQNLFSLLGSILSTKDRYQRLLQYRGDQAQLLVDTLQWVSAPSSIGTSCNLIYLQLLCVHPSLEGSLRRKFTQALLRLSKRAKLVPKSLILLGVQIGDVIVETSNVDIFRGLHGGREVCLKKYRVRRSQSNGIRDGLVAVCGIIHTLSLDVERSSISF